MAVTKREQQMLDLADKGLSRDEIASAMGISSSVVTARLTFLHPNLAADRSREEAVRRGSKALLAAIVSAGYATCKMRRNDAHD